MSIFLNLHFCNSPNSHKKLRKEPKLISVKHKRKRKHNFIEVENELLMESQ